MLVKVTLTTCLSTILLMIITAVSNTYSISYCKDNIKCDSASNAPKWSLNKGMSIVQKLVAKLSNTSTTFSQQQKLPFKQHKMTTNCDVHSAPYILHVCIDKPVCFL